MEETKHFVQDGPTKGQKAERAFFSSDHIYIISDAKLKELKDKGIEEPRELAESVEFFKKHHTKKLDKAKKTSCQWNKGIQGLQVF